MKKIFKHTLATAMMCGMAIAAQAQNEYSIIIPSDGTQIPAGDNMTIMPVALEDVDLDLPSHNIWASCNLGAKDKNDPGGYYSPGEDRLVPKTSFNKEDWRFNENYCYGFYFNRLRSWVYNLSSEQKKGKDVHGITSSRIYRSTYNYTTDINMDPCYNVWPKVTHPQFSPKVFDEQTGNDIPASEIEEVLYRDNQYVCWYSNWELPTKDDYKELWDYCDKEIVDGKPVKMLKLTSKRNGKVLYLPMGGYKYGNNNTTWLNELGEYMTCTFYNSGDTYTWYKFELRYIGYTDLKYIFQTDSPHQGQMVRPVKHPNYMGIIIN